MLTISSTLETENSSLCFTFSLLSQSNRSIHRSSQIVQEIFIRGMNQSKLLLRVGGLIEGREEPEKLSDATDCDFQKLRCASLSVLVVVSAREALNSTPILSNLETTMKM